MTYKLDTHRLDGANLILADAKMSLEEAVAGKAAEKAAAAAASAASTAGAATKGYQEGIVPKVPVTPTLMEQIMGGDDLVLTLMASITLLLGVVVTVGAVYLTVVNYQEEQYKEKLSDASSAEYREMAKEIMALEAEVSSLSVPWPGLRNLGKCLGFSASQYRPIVTPPLPSPWTSLCASIYCQVGICCVVYPHAVSQTKGAVSSKGRAMKEALSMDKESNKNTKGSTNTLLAEPGDVPTRP